MARGRRSGITQNITPDQAHYILSRLVEDGRLSNAEVKSYLKGVEDEIRQLESRLSQLRGAYGRKSAPTGGAPRRNAATPKRKRNVTPEQLASRQLQGQYMSLIRQFPPEKREQFKSLSKKEGREAAVRRMKADLG